MSSDDLRATLWLRWPDEEAGPLWAAVHVNRRRGVSVPVGVEVWTEPPGAARADLGPEGDPADDLLPWAARTLRSSDLRALSLPSLLGRLLLSLPADGSQSPVGPPESRAKPGRPPSYGPDHWRAVAAVYERADPSARRRAIAEAFSVSMSTAKHWVDRCRRAGLLD